MAHDVLRATARNASRILAVVEASVLLCVSVTACLSIALCDCIKTVQARITISSLSAAKNLTSFKISKTVRVWPRLLLIGYRKFHMSFRSTPKSTTLYNLETQNNGFS